MKETRLVLHIILLFIICILSFPKETTGQIIHVAPNGTGNGSTWATAAGNLKLVLENVDSGAVIWVQEGTYRPASCANCVFNDRNQSFRIPTGVQVYGGFAGWENSLDQRNWEAHPSILSGDIDQNGDTTNNSYTIVYTHNVDTSTVLDGFIITGGFSNESGAGLGTPQTSGGGWFNLGSTPGGSSSPTIANCKFIENYAWGYGGAMFNDGSFEGKCNPRLNNCLFKNNVAANGGGAIYNTGSFEGICNPVLVGCTFERNMAEMSDGGAIFNVGAEAGVCNPSLTECIFRENYAYEGGAICNFGKGGNSKPMLKNCLFESNEAAFGGAVFNDGTFDGFCSAAFVSCAFIQNHSLNDGGAMYNSGYLGACNPSLMECLFQENESGFGGGAIFSNGVEGVCNASIVNCRFVKNIADTYGGAMYNQGKTGNASPTISNCIFQENTALSAGAVYNLGADNGNANVLFTNCTFFGNHANVGGAVYCNAGEGGTGVASPTVRNCIFWQNTATAEGDIFRIIWGTPTISHSLVDKPDCNALYNGMGGSVTCGAGLIFDENPGFISPASGNFHLSDHSPAVDKGSNQAVSDANILIDLDSLPRIFNSTVDLGVFEFGSMVAIEPSFTQEPVSLEVCEGETAVFSVSAAGSLPLVFQWQKNGSDILGAKGSVLTIPDASAADSAAYQCWVTNSTGEVVFSEEATLTVKSPVEVSLTITASETEICQGEQMTFTALPINGGEDPIFHWFKNGNLIGDSLATLEAVNSANGDTFYCLLISSENCVLNPSANSNSITVHVESGLTAALSIASDAEVICENQQVTFTATPVNGGTSPSFQWSLNGSPVGGNYPIFTAANFQVGDQILCTMWSSKNCVVVNPVPSNLLTLQVTPNEIASIEITASVDSTFCIGTMVHFEASIENGGAEPHFQWFVNGVLVYDNPGFSTNSLADGDEIVCYLTSSEACLVENPVVSNVVEVSADSCEVAASEKFSPETEFFVFPNPTAANFIVGIHNPSATFALKILNINGETLVSTFENPSRIPYRRSFDLTGFPKGIYFLQLSTEKFTSVKKLLLQ